MASSSKVKTFSVSEDALNQTQDLSETQLGIIGCLFNNNTPFSKDILTTMCELYVLHSSLISFVDLIKEGPKHEEKDAYSLTTQDLQLMRSIQIGYETLQKKLEVHNIYVVVN